MHLCLNFPEQRLAGNVYEYYMNTSVEVAGVEDSSILLQEQMKMMRCKGWAADRRLLLSKFKCQEELLDYVYCSCGIYWKLYLQLGLWLLLEVCFCDFLLKLTKQVSHLLTVHYLVWLPHTFIGLLLVR